MAAEIDEEMQQELEWRQRLVRAVLSREFDNETTIELVLAGLDQAHDEGLRDAAWVCRRLAGSEGTAKSHREAAAVCERAIGRLRKLNTQ